MDGWCVTLQFSIVPLNRIKTNLKEFYLNEVWSGIKICSYSMAALVDTEPTIRNVVFTFEDPNTHFQHTSLTKVNIKNMDIPSLRTTVESIMGSMRILTGYTIPDTPDTYTFEDVPLTADTLDNEKKKGPYDTRPDIYVKLVIARGNKVAPVLLVGGSKRKRRRTKRRKRTRRTRKQ